MFSCMKKSCTFYRYLGPQILSLVNIKNQTNGKKGIIFLIALLKWILSLSIKLYHLLFIQMHYMNIAKHRCTHYISMKAN